MAKPVVITAGGALSPSRKKASLTNGAGKSIADEKSPDKAAGSKSPVKKSENKCPNIDLEIPDFAIQREKGRSLDEEGLSYDDDEDFDLSYAEEERLISDEEKGHEDDEMSPDDLYEPSAPTKASDAPSLPTYIWLAICFFGIMFSFVAYGLLLEYATTGGRKLHELSFLFVTSFLYTTTAAAGRYVRDEEPTTIPPARFAVLGMTSMGSTFCSVRSLRYVIFPIQVLAKSCKPVPVMIMGALMGKKYPLRKYLNVCLIVGGVGLFMGGGSSNKSSSSDDLSAGSQAMGIILLFISLCFDGGTGAYEDKLMAVHHVGPFDLMYNIQLGKTIIAGVSLLVLNQVHMFLQMCQEMGFVLIALGFTGAMGQVFIFVTIAKFGALTCSIIGLSRKVTTLVASIYFYGHSLNAVQCAGLLIAVGAMVMNFMGKKGNGGGGHGHPSKSKDLATTQTPYADIPPQGEVELSTHENERKPLTTGGQ